MRPVTIHISVTIQGLTTRRITSRIWNSLLHGHLHTHFPLSTHSVTLWESLSLGLTPKGLRQVFIVSRELSHPKCSLIHLSDSSWFKQGRGGLLITSNGLRSIANSLSSASASALSAISVRFPALRV